MSKNTEFEFMYPDHKSLYNCLVRGGIHTLDELGQVTKRQLYRIRNLGRRKYEELLKLAIDNNFEYIFQDNDILDDLIEMKNNGYSSPLKSSDPKEDTSVDRINPFIEARYKLGYHSRTEFEDEIKLGRGTYYRWEHGKSPTTNNKATIAVANFCAMTGWTNEEFATKLAMVYNWYRLGCKVISPTWVDTPKVLLADCIKTEDKSVEDETANLVEPNPLVMWRLANGYSEIRMSGKAGIDLERYKLIEAGKEKPTYVEAEEISKFTDIPITDIISFYYNDKADDDFDTPEPEPENKPLLSKSTVERLNDSLKKSGEAILRGMSAVAKTAAETAIKLPKIQTVEYGGEVYPSQVESNPPAEIDLSRKILNIVYGKLSLEEYLQIIEILKYKEV